MTVYYVVQVPPGMTPEEAWAEIQTMGEIVEHRWWHRFRRRSWAVIEADD